MGHERAHAQLLGQDGADRRRNLKAFHGKRATSIPGAPGSGTANFTWRQRPHHGACAWCTLRVDVEEKLW
jgi:hypothetical protein